MRLAVLLLCHEPPARIAQRLRSAFFRSDAVKVYLHYDAKRSAADFQALKALLKADGPAVSFVEDRVHCGWGEYSLVDATHKLLRVALADDQFPADYLALISGSCMPIRPLGSLLEFLRRRRGIDFIQAHDIRFSPWVTGGLQEERYRYYFPFNFIEQRWKFEKFTALQRRLGVQRKMPEDLRIHFGSQWFCLTRDTSRHVVEQLDKPALRNFFARSWIPDEFAIQTLVANHRKPAFIANHNLTYYEFDRNGLPLVLDNGHFDHLMRQPFFFARKIAPEAAALQAELESHVAGPEYDLSYFDRIGQPTTDFHTFLTTAEERKSVRSHIGTVEDSWRGPLDVSQRRYYVLYASSRRYLLSLLAAARSSGTQMPVFDFLFEPDELQPAHERGAYLGLQVSDRRRRDHDPRAFLHEVVHIDLQRPAAFGLDPAAQVWMRDFAVWDKNAVLLSCDPPNTTTAQRAAAAIRDLDSVRDAKRVSTVVAGVLRSGTLPVDHFRDAQRKGEHTCQFMSLHDLPPHGHDDTLAALRAAITRVDPAPFYQSVGRADELVLG